MEKLSVRCIGVMGRFVNEVIHQCPGTVFSYGFCLNAGGVSIVFESAHPELKQAIEEKGYEWHEYNQHPSTITTLSDYEVPRSKK